MFRLHIAAALYVLLFLGSSPGSPPVAAGQAVRPQSPLPAVRQALDWEKLTSRQFAQLPDTQPILFQGKTTTLGDVRVQLRAWQTQTAARRTSSRARANDASVRARSRMEAKVRAFNQQQLKNASAAMAVMKAELMRVKNGEPDFPSGDIPRITKVFGVIQPGGSVLIGGENFGTKPGRVRMLIPGASWELNLEKLEWYPSGIGGRIPNNPALVKGAEARFVVETNSGAASLPWSVNWVVQIKQLPKDDVRLISCSQDANWNLCNTTTTHILACVGGTGWPPSQLADSTFFGWHRNCWGAVGDDSGVDEFEITLKNGWTLHDIEFIPVSEEGEGFVNGPGTFPVGATHWKPSVAWSVTPADEIYYKAHVYIRGPKGVPHK